MKAAIAISLATLFVAGSSRGDSGHTAPPQLTPSLDEPTTESPAESVKGAETPARDPFTPYDVGKPGTKVWSYEQLSAGEKEQASLGRRAQLGAATIDAFGAGVRERSHQAAGRSAAQKLGLEHLELIGVVR